MSTAPTEDDIETLDAYLMSDRAPEECLLLSDLDGFLTAVAVSPEPVPESEWLPAIWNGEAPRFESPEEEKRILSIITGRRDEIADLLANDPDSYAPWFWASDEGDPVASDWAEGFLLGIGLRPEAWRPLLESEEGLALVGPIAAFWGSEDEEFDEDDFDEDELDDEPETPEAAAAGDAAVNGVDSAGALDEDAVAELEGLLEQMVGLIPDAVIGIRNHWAATRH